MTTEKGKYIAEPMKSIKEGQERKNIYQRIIEVMKRVDYIQKVDKAAKGLPYKYVSHDQVTGALHMPMAEAGIVAITDIVEMTQEGNRTTVKISLSLVNADDPKDFITVSSYGYGIDQQDKGPGKAISYASKMALLKIFMLETGEDPEKDNEDFKPDIEALYKQAHSLIDRLEINRQMEFYEFLKKTYNVDKVELLKLEETKRIIKLLEDSMRKGIEVKK
jgi:hypothetical protein